MTYDIRVKAKDANGKIATKDFTLTVTKETTALTNKFTVSATAINLGDSVKVTGAAAGGTSPYQYAVYYKKASSTSYTTAQTYSTNKTVTIKPSVATTYDIRTKVKDSTGKVVNKDFTVKVSGVTGNQSTISSNSITLGQDVTITCKCSGGQSPYQYGVYVKKASSDTYTTLQAYSTTAKVLFTPQTATTYNIRVRAKDKTGFVRAKDFTVKVSKASGMVNLSSVSAISISKGDSVTVTANAANGTTPYKYYIAYKKASSDTYTKVQGYSTTKKATIKPASATTYNIIVKAKDASGTIKSKTFTITVQ